MLMGCVQPSMMPNINSATARVLDAAGIQTLVADEAGCCGAIRLHLDDHDGALDHMRRNIDAWWPLVSTGAVEAIVMNASGCGVTVKEYGHSLARDPDYAEKATRIADLTRDLSELLPDIVEAGLEGARRSRRSGRQLQRRGRTPRVPSALHAAARPAPARRRRGRPRGARLRGRRGDERGAPVLRLGRHLLGAAARARDRTARPQARQPGGARIPRRSSRPTSAASSTCRPARRRRCGTGSRCSTTRSRDALTRRPVRIRRTPP